MNQEWMSDEMTGAILRCVITVHPTLGPGFVEEIYRRPLHHELREQGLTAESEVVVRGFYDGVEVGCHRVDLLVEKRGVLELKAVSELAQVHYAQLRSTVKAAGLSAGLPANSSKSMAEYRRIEL